MTYIAGIDGLRAIAVLAVVIYHITFTAPSGGFVGVDIFFVISGFLISGIIYREKLSGEFSYAGFYKRRIRRILPALYFMLIICALVGYVLMLPEDVRYLNKSMQNILMFVSNLFFQKDIEYAGPKFFEVTFVHSWSLAVEEQFYFIWPLVLSIILMFTKRLIPVLLFSIICFSFVLPEITSAVKTSMGPNAYYYSLIARCGELLIGASIAMFVSHDIERYKKILPINLLTLIGLILVFYSIIFIEFNLGFPGFNAIYPSLGTGLVLVGVLANSPVTKFLEIKLLRNIGKISYSLYLWHWPILSYMYYVNQGYNLPVAWIILAIGLMFALSIFSYKFIETPIRKLDWSFRKTFILIYLLPTIFIFGLCFASKKLIIQQPQDQELVSYGGGEICHGIISESCIRGDVGLTPRILVLGDSHAAHFNYFLDEVGKKQGFSSLVLSASSCSPVLGFSENILPEYARKPCANLKNYLIDNIDRFETVVLASMWSFQLGLEEEASDPDYLAKFEETLSYLQDKGKNIYVFSQVPYLESNPLRAAKHAKLNFATKHGVLDKYKIANAQILAVVKKYPNVHWLDVTSVVEDNNMYVDDEKPLYFDRHHLNIYGSKLLATKWIEKHEKTFR